MLGLENYVEKFNQDIEENNIKLEKTERIIDKEAVDSESAVEGTDAVEAVDDVTARQIRELKAANRETAKMITSGIEEELERLEESARKKKRKASEVSEIQMGNADTLEKSAKGEYKPDIDAAAEVFKERAIIHGDQAAVFDEQGQIAIEDIDDAKKRIQDIHNN